MRFHSVLDEAHDLVKVGYERIAIEEGFGGERFQVITGHGSSPFVGLTGAPSEVSSKAPMLLSALLPRRMVVRIRVSSNSDQVHSQPAEEAQWNR